MRVIARERPHAARRVADARRLNLDDVGAVVRQQPGAERGGHVTAQLQYPDAVERQQPRNARRYHASASHATGSDWPALGSTMVAVPDAV